MYYYFARSAFGARLWWRRYLTQLQIGQFAVAIPCTVAWGYYHWSQLGGCSEVSTLLAFGLFDGTLLFLFLQFFLGMGGGSKPRMKKKKST